MASRNSDLVSGGRQKVAYRAIATTCEVSSAYVGLPVQIAVVDSTGSRVLGAEELEEVETAVERWNALEADTLAMGGAAAGDQVKGDLPEIAPADANTS
jgi:hypothetical protein